MPSRFELYVRNAWMGAWLRVKKYSQFHRRPCTGGDLCGAASKCHTAFGGRAWGLQAGPLRANDSSKGYLLD